MIRSFKIIMLTLLLNYTYRIINKNFTAKTFTVLPSHIFSVLVLHLERKLCINLSGDPNDYAKSTISHNVLKRNISFNHCDFTIFQFKYTIWL